MRLLSEEQFLLFLSIDIKMIVETLVDYISKEQYEHCMLLHANLDVAKCLEDFIPLKIQLNLSTGQKAIGDFYYGVHENKAQTREFKIGFSLSLERTVTEHEFEFFEYFGFLTQNLLKSTDVVCMLP